MPCTRYSRGKTWAVRKAARLYLQQGDPLCGQHFGDLEWKAQQALDPKASHVCSAHLLSKQSTLSSSFCWKKRHVWEGCWWQARRIKPSPWYLHEASSPFRSHWVSLLSFSFLGWLSGKPSSLRVWFGKKSPRRWLLFSCHSGWVFMFLFALPSGANQAYCQKPCPRIREKSNTKDILLRLFVCFSI